MACEVQARVYEARSQPVPARAGVDQQDAQLRGRLVGRHTEDAPSALAVDLGDPGDLPRGVVVGGVVGDDARD